MKRNEEGVRVFFVTPVCNNRCLMCCSPTFQESMNDHPPFEHLKREAEKLEGVKEIYMTGGEPSTSPDIFRIIRHVKSKRPGIKINIITNGRMFYYMDYAKKIARLGINRIVTEIHGPDAGTHDKITRAAGSFEQTVKGIRNLIGLGQRTELRIVVHKMNYQKLEETADFIAKNLSGIGSVIIFPFNIVSHGLRNRKRLQVKYRDIIPYVKKAVDLLHKNNFDVQLYHTPFCVISSKYWKFISGVTAEDYKLAKTEECSVCSKQKECPLIWSSYIKFNGSDEFKAR